MEYRFKDLRINTYDNTGKELPVLELARQLGIDHNKIDRLEKENGFKQIEPETLEKYSDYFGVSTDYILGLSDLKTKNEDIKMISKYTGLDEESLQIVNDMNTQSSPEHERWVATLNAVIHNPNILYYLSELIYAKQIYGIVQPGDNEDEIKEGNLVLRVEGYPHFHPIDEHLIDIDIWERLKELVNGLKKRRKDGDMNGKESSVSSKRNRQRNKTKRSQA